MKPGISMGPRLRVQFEPQELERFQDPLYLLRRLKIAHPVNLKIGRQCGPATLQKLARGIITRPKEARKGVGWEGRVQRDPRGYTVAEIQRLIRNCRSSTDKESFQRLGFDERGMPSPASGTCQTDGIREGQVEAILYVCDWEADDEGTITVYRQLNDRFRATFFFGQHATPLDVNRAIWAAACMQAGEGSFETMVRRLEATAADPSRYELLPTQQVGRGTYGTVHLGLFRGKQQLLLAIKTTRISTSRAPTDDSLHDGLRALANEMRALREIEPGHHLPTLHGYSLDLAGNKLSLYMSHCPGQSVDRLLTLLHRFGEPVMSWIAHDLLQALAHLHDDKGIVHRDVHWGNVMVYGWEEALTRPQGFSACLVDVGNCHRLTDRRDSSVGEQGFRHESRVEGGGYQAPEFLSGQRAATRKMDIWSVGSVTARVLLNDAKRSVLLAKEAKVGLDVLAGTRLSRHAKDFINACWTVDYRTRPCATQLLVHPFINTHMAARGIMDTTN